MKNSLVLVSASALFLLTACEKKTTTVKNDEGGTTKIETVGFDKEKIDSTAENIEEGVKDAAGQAGEALETAGQKLKKGAENLEENAQEATDGDGNINK
ncbi:hypothetical protein [Planobacterium oryzisoli]|uniref:Uncharacterized protein n=1 Tax=Planobacterium oryzisoli TaxID=2771435 RepID=A0A930YWV6_9FLAO|nr:hypothetical protein [Planobacterium oryzisoli]MBF5027835.1 hypothetical protein [Planobacterium oryzisoli]